jgi:hypothetical protein
MTTTVIVIMSVAEARSARLQVTGHRLQGVAPTLSRVRSCAAEWLLALGSWLLALGPWPLAQHPQTVKADLVRCEQGWV